MVYLGMEKRMLCDIASEIARDWKPVNYAAKPYLDAMQSMGDITDSYMMENGSGIVARFLCNAGSWRGEAAKRIKAELKVMLKG